MLCFGISTPGTGRWMGFRLLMKGITMQYKVRLIESEEGFAVWCPSLPGCWSQGLTEEKAHENIEDAIIEYAAAVEDMHVLQA